jgi:bacterioferritin (cytochrome b1)
MAKTTFNNMLAEYNANVENLENLKKVFFTAAMHKNYKKMDELSEAILNYEQDIRAFEQQLVEYKHVGEK